MNVQQYRQKMLCIFNVIIFTKCGHHGALAGALIVEDHRFMKIMYFTCCNAAILLKL